MKIELEHIRPETATQEEQWLMKVIKYDSLTICKLTEIEYEAVSYLQYQVKKSENYQKELTGIINSGKTFSIQKT